MLPSVDTRYRDPVAPLVDRSLDPTSPDFVARVGRQLGWHEHKLPARPIDSEHVRELVGPSFQLTVGDALGVFASVEGDVTMEELEAAALALAPLDTGCHLWQAKLRQDGRYDVSFSVSLGSPFPGVTPGGPHRSWPREPAGSLELNSFETCACGAMHVVLAPRRSQSGQERRTTSFPCLGCGRWILHAHGIPEGRGCEVHRALTVR